jgi:hypothetical protein
VLHGPHWRLTPGWPQHHQARLLPLLLLLLLLPPLLLWRAACAAGAGCVRWCVQQQH